MHSKLCFGIKNTLMHLNLNTSISYNACQSFHIKKVRKSIKLIFVWNIITGIFFSCNNAKKPRDFREKKKTPRNFRELTQRFRECSRNFSYIHVQKGDVSHISVPFFVKKRIKIMICWICTLVSKIKYKLFWFYQNRNSKLNQY